MGVGLVLAAYWQLFTTFMVYDDEGYVLVSLKHYSLQGGLYDRVYTQYGPFPYLLYDFLHSILGFEFNNTSGRWITLVNWVGSAAVCGSLVFSFTRSLVWSAFTLAASFLYLSPMVNEPIHPGGLIAFVVAIGTWLGATLWQARRVRWFCVTLGGICGMLALTKINVGVFFGAAVVAWLAINGGSSRTSRNLIWALALGCTLLPFGLMRGLIDHDWARFYAIVFTTSILSLFTGAFHFSSRVTTARDLAWFVLAFTVTVLALAGLTLASGTSVEGLIEGVIRGPLRHPGVYFFSPRWLPGTAVVAIGSLVLSCWLGANRARVKRLRPVISWLRVLTALSCIPSIVKGGSLDLSNWGLCYGVTLAWLFALPLRDDTGSGHVRLWVSLVLVFQCLHAYPVAGSQLSWGTFLWIPLMVLGLVEARSFLLVDSPRGQNWGAKLETLLVGSTTVVAVLGLMHLGWSRYSTSVPLRLAGAYNIRPAILLTYSSRVATENLRAHADMLFSLPGLYSANLWTNLPTPTAANATHWFSLLSDSQQREIIIQLSLHPRAAVLVERGLVNYLHKQGFAVAGPLYRWITDNFERRVSFLGYEIWLHKGRSMAALSTVKVFATVPGFIDGLDLTLSGCPAPVASIQLCDIGKPSVPLCTFAPEYTKIEVARCSLDGDLQSPLGSARLPLTIAGPSLLRLRFGPIRVHGAISGILIVLRGPSGEVLKELVIADEADTST
jgi:hypothetical protein